MKHYDLHTHSMLSDGELIPSELARRAEELGHAVIAITDHADVSNVDFLVKRLVKVAAELNDHMDIRVVPGIELTHIPPRTISRIAKLARRLGAELVLVHGETIVEPVKPGTNDAALSCDEVDILAHPGMLTLEQAEQARDAGIYLELTSRRGHCLTNGWIAYVANRTKAKLLVNTDAHAPNDLLTFKQALTVARGAGLDEREAERVVVENPKDLLRRLR